MDRLGFLRQNHITYVAVLYADSYDQQYYRWLDGQDYLHLVTRYHDGAIYQVLP
jgi:hypothetical protein